MLVLLWDADLGVPFSGDCNALTEFAQEGDGRLGTGYECRFLLRTQVVVI